MPKHEKTFDDEIQETEAPKPRTISETTGSPARVIAEIDSAQFMAPPQGKGGRLTAVARAMGVDTRIFLVERFGMPWIAVVGSTVPLDTFVPFSNVTSIIFADDRDAQKAAIAHAELEMKRAAEENLRKRQEAAMAAAGERDKNRKIPIET